MAAKDIMLRKKLIKESVLAVVLIVALAGGGYALSTYDDDTQAEKTATESANAGIRGQRESIQQEMGAGLDVTAFYNLYFKFHNPDLGINRDAAAAWISAAKEKHHLANMSLTISPIGEIGLDFAHLKANAASKSDVVLTFGAITDSSIYNFIEAIQTGFPGIVAIKEVKISRTGDLSSTMVTEMSQHKLLPIVSGELSFSWLGLHPIEEGKNKDSSVPGQGGVR